MKSRKRKVCRWCEQPLPEWSEHWPHEPGLYAFFGYPINIEVDQHPKFMLVTVESYNDMFGTIWRGPRVTLKPSTGAAGFWMPLLVPPEKPAESDLMAIAEVALEASKRVRIKRINRRSARRLK